MKLLIAVAVIAASCFTACSPSTSGEEGHEPQNTGSIASSQPEPQEPPAPIPAAQPTTPVALPPADITEMTTCGAAALKMGDINLWKKWAEALQDRYALIYPEKSTTEVESYMLERVLDKRRRLQDQGIDSSRAFTSYFNKNCLGILGDDP